MDWSILLGAAVIAYAAWILIRHLRRIRRGDCRCCGEKACCNGHCQEHKK